MVWKWWSHGFVDCYWSKDWSKTFATFTWTQTTEGSIRLKILQFEPVNPKTLIQCYWRSLTPREKRCFSGGEYFEWWPCARPLGSCPSRWANVISACVRPQHGVWVVFSASRARKFDCCWSWRPKGQKHQVVQFEVATSKQTKDVWTTCSLYRTLEVHLLLLPLFLES